MLSTFEVIAEPNRRRILDLLCDEERSVGELVARLELSQPTVSKHLKVLRQARLVRAQVSAQRRLYRLDPAPLMELEAWLEPYRRFWNDRLDALGRHLDRRAELERGALSTSVAAREPPTATKQRRSGGPHTTPARTKRRPSKRRKTT